MGSSPTGGVCSPSGQMDKASVSGAEDWGFESPLGCTAFGFCATGTANTSSGKFSTESCNGARSVMVIIGASQALDPGSIPGERRIGALAQSEECVLCKHEVRGSKPRCSRYFLFFCASAKFSFRKCSISEGYRLGWPSGPRRSTQVRVSSEAWVRIPLQAISRGIGLVV